MATTYTKVTDALTGAVSFIESPAGQSAGDWLTARGTETTTHLGMATGAALLPLILGTITAALAGDIPGAMLSGVPALLGIAGALAAIITPTPKGATDAQIKTAVTALSHDELIKLLTPASQPSVVQTAATSGQLCTTDGNDR
jgi:hypothetical protein